LLYVALNRLVVDNHNSDIIAFGIDNLEFYTYIFR